MCRHAFDPQYEKACDKLKENGWSIRYFYNQQTDNCVKFWYGGCQLLNSLNIFNDLQSCEILCVQRPKQLPAITESPISTAVQPLTTTDQLREMAATTTEMPFPGFGVEQFFVILKIV